MLVKNINLVVFVFMNIFIRRLTITALHHLVFKDAVLTLRAATTVIVHLEELENTVRKTARNALNSIATVRNNPIYYTIKK